MLGRIAGELGLTGRAPRDAVTAVRAVLRRRLPVLDGPRGVDRPPHGARGLPPPDAEPDTASTSRRRPCSSCGRPESPRGTRSATRCPSGARTRGASSSAPATPTRGRRRGWTERGATSIRRPPGWAATEASSATVWEPLADLASWARLRLLALALERPGDAVSRLPGVAAGAAGRLPRLAPLLPAPGRPRSRAGPDRSRPAPPPVPAETPSST